MLGSPYRSAAQPANGEMKREQIHLKLKNPATAAVISTTDQLVLAQNPHGAEPVSDHYKQLLALSPQANPQRSATDTIHYPPKEYGSSSIYLIVKPYYLTDQQVEALKTSVEPPANSSDQTRKELDYLLQLQQGRSPEQVKRVEFLGAIGYWPSTDLIPSHPEYAQNLRDLFFEGSEVLGATCTADRYPQTAKLLKGIMRGHEDHGIYNQVSL